MRMCPVITRTSENVMCCYENKSEYGMRHMLALQLMAGQTIAKILKDSVPNVEKMRGQCHVVSE